MSFYRNVYLKSEDWRVLRSAKLHRQKNRCQICGFVSEHNDVHHVKYGKLHDVNLLHLRVLCRSCHDKTHELLEKYPKLKKLDRNTIWKTVRDHLRKDERDKKAAIASKRTPRSIARKRVAAVPLFVSVRKQLVDAGEVFKTRMPWKEILLSSPKLLEKIQPTEDFIIFYQAITGLNPRRMDFEPMQKPLVLIENEATH